MACAPAGKSGGKYIWHTVGDDKVRDSHAALEGTVRSWDESPVPGEEENCRCWAEPLPNDPPIQPVYPELLILPFLRGGWIIKAWRDWIKNSRKNSEWKLGKHKSPQRWARQMEKRGWTPQKITDTIKNGKQYPAPNKVNPGNPATRYETKNGFVVKDDITGEIIQVSGPPPFYPETL